jgi:hypothetical protein
MRFGVHLPPLKVALFDVVKAAGDIGVSTTELIATLNEHLGRRLAAQTIKAHVFQINELLAGTDYQIRSERRGGEHPNGGRPAFWVLEHTPMRESAKVCGRRW